MFRLIVEPGVEVNSEWINFIFLIISYQFVVVNFVVKYHKRLYNFCIIFSLKQQHRFSYSLIHTFAKLIGIVFYLKKITFAFHFYCNRVFVVIKMEKFTFFPVKNNFKIYDFNRFHVSLRS